MNGTGVNIRPLRLGEVAGAKLLIATVCREIFGWEPSPEEILRRWEATSHLGDIDDVQNHYFGNRGTFLVLSDADLIVGTGAIRRLDSDVCELKRMWFLPQYRRQGHGTRMVAQLLQVAIDAGYKRVRLDTGSNQDAAIRFYTKLGFTPIDRYNDSVCDLFMEKVLTTGESGGAAS